MHCISLHYRAFCPRHSRSSRITSQPRHPAGLRKIASVVLHQKRERITARPAGKAVKQSFGFTHLQRRLFVGVKRAESGMAATLLPKREVAANDTDNIQIVVHDCLLSVVFSGLQKRVKLGLRAISAMPVCAFRLFSTCTISRLLMSLPLLSFVIFQREGL